MRERTACWAMTDRGEPGEGVFACTGDDIGLTDSEESRRGASRTFALEALEARCLLAGDLISQWLADDLNATVGDGSAIVRWHDSQGDIEALAVGAPTLVTDAVGGRSTVRFEPADGTDGFRVRSTDNPVVGAETFRSSSHFKPIHRHSRASRARWFDNTGLVDSDARGFSYDWGLTINAAGQLSAGFGDSGDPTTTIYSTVSGLNNGQLHFTALSRSGSHVALYVDDQPADTATA